jgi:hypothetical protein
MTLERGNRVRISSGVCSTIQTGFTPPIESGRSHSIWKRSYTTITRSQGESWTSLARRASARKQRRAQAGRSPTWRYQACAATEHVPVAATEPTITWRPEPGPATSVASLCRGAHGPLAHGRYQAYKTRDTSWTPRSHSYATARWRERHGVEDGESNTTTRRHVVESGKIRCRSCAVSPVPVYMRLRSYMNTSSTPAPANCIRRLLPR